MFPSTDEIIENFVAKNYFRLSGPSVIPWTWVQIPVGGIFSGRKGLIVPVICPERGNDNRKPAKLH